MLEMPVLSDSLDLTPANIGGGVFLTLPLRLYAQNSRARKDFSK